MQEGALSLMQLSKVSAHLSNFSKKGGLYVSILTYPTTGGVTASFGMQADITIAEPKALIGFAGQRVIKQTTSQDLPEGFQTSEFLMEKGFVDLIVNRNNLKNKLINILSVLK
jgi:acetyl-CoA carboxylase carboxyl transferase subunit beta